jgi:hypothetical protein
MITSWRDFDLTKRVRNIERAFRREKISSPEEFCIIANTPCYFGFGNNRRSTDYWNDPAYMVKFQEDAFMEHLSQVDDDTMPYFMPWFGTGVLASAFGCPVKEATGDGDDPAVHGYCIHDVKDIAKLKMPDPYRDGQMPRVLKFIDYAREHSDLPVGLTDMNSPLSTMMQMCGYENAFYWMYDEPQAIHDLMAMITEAFIEWVKVQKEHSGHELDETGGLQGVASPKGMGVWVSDDDLVTVTPALYEEFVVPYYSRLFTEFGGGHLHYCGNGRHQTENILKIEGVRAINNSPMGKVDIFAELVKKAGCGRRTIEIQDGAPVDIEGYYPRLFKPLEDIRGIMLATFVSDNLGMDNEGNTVIVKRDAIADVKRLVKTVRECVAEKLE